LNKLLSEIDGIPFDDDNEALSITGVTRTLYAQIAGTVGMPLKGKENSAHSTATRGLGSSAPVR
jgi:hypothetical protein